MEWTLEQVEEMRSGRSTFGDREKSGALALLRTSAETGGEYSLLYGEIGPGYRVFPHYHTLYTETFKILEGAITGQVGDQRVSLGAGDEAVVRPRTVHGWSGTSTEGLSKAIVELRPAHEGFEKWLMILHNMAADGLTSPDLRPHSIVHTALFLVESDTHLPGSARILNPVFKAVAWVARRAGISRKLEEKYYRPSMLRA